MKLFRHQRNVLQELESRMEASLAGLPSSASSSLGNVSSRLEAALPDGAAADLALKAAWVLAGFSVLAIGLLAGRELRGRYMFKRRTPYDYYAHAGDRHDMEFGVGI